MTIKKLRIQDYLNLKIHGTTVPWSTRAQVSKSYKIYNPEDPNEYIIAVCSQNMPVCFRLKEICVDIETDGLLDCSGSLNKTIYETEAFKSGEEYVKTQLKRAINLETNKTSSILQKQPKALL